MPIRPLTKADIVAVANYITERATIMKNKSGKEFIGLDGFQHTIGGLHGQLRFGYFGLSDVTESKERLTQNVVDNIARLSPEEKQALLERLMAE